MKKIIAIVLTFVMVISMSSMAFAGTITAPEAVVAGEVLTVSIVGDNGSGNTATVVWTVNGEPFTTTATKNEEGKWVSELEIQNVQGESYNIDAIINKFTGNGKLQSSEVSDAVTVEVVESSTPADTTPPTLTYTLNPAEPEGLNGWYTNPVTVSFTAVDNEGGSGIKTDTKPAEYTLNNDGEYEAKEFTVEDNAGNIGRVTVPAIKIDATKPVINVPQNDQVFVLNSSAQPDWSATDATSGIFSSQITGFSTSTVGTKSYKITAKDNAGNTETVEVSYRVIYNFGGILQPINRNGSSVFKAGSTVPVKFQLTDANGTFVNDATATIKYAKLDNTVWGADIEAVSTAASTTNNLFRYDAVSNQYIFNLSTKGLTAGTYQLSIALGDGTTQTVIIGLK